MLHATYLTTLALPRHRYIFNSFVFLSTKSPTRKDSIHSLDLIRIDTPQLDPLTAGGLIGHDEDAVERTHTPATLANKP